MTAIVSRRIAVIAGAVASAALTTTLVSPATGASIDVRDRDTVRSVTVNEVDDAPAFTSSMSLKFDKPISQRRAERVQQRLASALDSAGDHAAKKRTWKRMRCNKHYMWRHTKGIMNMQRKCGNKHLQWGFDIAPPVVAIVVGNVHETGLKWWRNGNKMPKNARHTEHPMYRFHGTMTGARKGDKIRYKDHYKFRHNIGPGGNGKLTVKGRLKMKGKKK